MLHLPDDFVFKTERARFEKVGNNRILEIFIDKIHLIGHISHDKRVCTIAQLLSGSVQYWKYSLLRPSMGSGLRKGGAGNAEAESPTIQPRRLDSLKK